MSYKRNISFAENEKDLLDYFDKNGRSRIVKDAMKYYIKNKDKLLLDDVKEVLKLIGSTQMGIPPVTHTQMGHKLNKLIK